MALITPIGNIRPVTFPQLIVFLAVFLFPLGVFGQFSTNCTAGGNTPLLHAEGLAEQIGDVTLTCTGGTAGSVLSTVVFVSINATITNRPDGNGNPTNIAVTVNTGSGPVALSVTPTFTSTSTLLFSQVQYKIPANPAQSVLIDISGIRAAMPTITNTGLTGTTFVSGTIQATAIGIGNDLPFLGQLMPTLLSSVLNNGIPCAGSPTPPTLDFPTLISTGTSSSTIRFTEGYVSAFLPKSPTDRDPADTGVRFLVNLSGYGGGATVYVPDAIVGNRGTVPTSGGAFNSTPGGGTYTPNSQQLLLVRVNGADATGAGGTLAFPAPAVATSFTSVTQLTLNNGSGYVTYEVLDSSPAQLDIAQLPVFVVSPTTSCNTVQVNTLGAMPAPVSTVAVPSQTAPIPRFLATAPASDCTVVGDCTAPYFPQLQVTQTSVTINGSSLGVPQNAYIQVSNAGSSQLTFNVSASYQTTAGLSTANWLTVSPAIGIVNAYAGIPTATVMLQANPAALVVTGAYQATVTINAGEAGTVTVPVTFNVGAAGPVIQSLVNSATLLAGPVTANSFATIFGLNLAAKNSLTVTFDGFPATVSYDGSSQINLLVPAALGTSANAGVIVTVDGVISNTFPITLAANAPAVFTPGILNQDNSVNLAASPESLGQIVQVFLTGLSTPLAGQVTVTIGGMSDLVPTYAGPVVSIPGLEQVNVQAPPGLTFTGNSAPLSICLQVTNAQQLCSVPVNLYLH